MPRQMCSQFMFLFFIRYVRNRIDHWCTVEPGNHNPRVHRSSGKLGEASFPTGTVDPRVGISLSPLNTNDGFSLSYSLVTSCVGHLSSLFFSVSRPCVLSLSFFLPFHLNPRGGRQTGIPVYQVLEGVS